jgi:hypothetical protein
MSGSTGSATGFNFTASPLLFNGQQIGGSFNFDLPLAAAGTATDAYNFVSGSNAAAQGFEDTVIHGQSTGANNLYVNEINYLAGIGQSFANAANNASNKVSSGGILGFLGL